MHALLCWFHELRIRSSVRRTIIAVMIGVLSQSLASAQLKEMRPTARTFTFRVIDQAGKLLSKVHVGSLALTGYPALKPSDASGWTYRDDAVSDENGIAKLLDSDGQIEGVYARDLDKGLVGIRRVTAADSGKVIPLQMAPACRVSGIVKFLKLVESTSEMPAFNLNVSTADGQQILSERSWNPQYSFFVPAGRYKLEIIQAQSHTTTQELTVPPGRGDLTIKPIETIPVKWATLQGKSAPDLHDVAAWKNGPVTLSQLRGRVVLLHFWGSWCEHCVAEMPEIISLHDKYNKEGLSVVAIHVDNGAGIDSAEKLDAAIAEARQKQWKGRDLPFPVALVNLNKVPFDNRVERLAHSPLVATYGIVFYPWTILIDRRGRIVSVIEPILESHRALIERALKDRP